MFSLKYAIWALMAGVLIPVMAMLNARLGRHLGEPLHAPVILFGVGLVFCVACALLITRSLPDLSRLSASEPVNFMGGMIVAFYVISATMVAPHFGVANFIMFAVVSQIIGSVVIDHFGLFGAAVRPVSGLRLLGIVILVSGLVITQFANSKTS